jgi:chromosome segregation ATPase
MDEPKVPEISTAIEPSNPFAEDSNFNSFRAKKSSIYSSELDPILPDVGERSKLSPPLLSEFETTDYSLTHYDVSSSKKAIHKDNMLTPTLHKLNTDSIEASPKLHDLHEQLFEYKELFQDKNKQVSDLEIHNVELDFRIASIEKEIATLIKEKLELTKQFNINNIKGMDPLSSSLLDKYKEAYLSITRNNLSITTKVSEIKDKLTFLDNTKHDLLKDIHYNRKLIDKLNVDKAIITKSIHAIEKITGNITKTPLS